MSPDADPTALGDIPQMTVALRRVGLGGSALDSGGSRRHDDGRVGMPRRDRGIHIIRIVRAVAGERCDRKPGKNLG
jgi:hypothetical protein